MTSDPYTRAVTDAELRDLAIAAQHVVSALDELETPETAICVECELWIARAKQLERILAFRKRGHEFVVVRHIGVSA